jgi:hypothetical protein
MINQNNSSGYYLRRKMNLGSPFKANNNLEDKEKSKVFISFYVDRMNQAKPMVEPKIYPT